MFYYVMASIGLGCVIGTAFDAGTSVLGYVLKKLCNEEDTEVVEVIDMKK